jgi:hypothetical protein
MNKAIFACLTPYEAFWQLGPLPPMRGHITLVGWRLSRRAIDEGMPADVGAALVSALASIATLNFLASEAPPTGGGETRTFHRSFFDRITSRMRLEPTKILMVSTCDPSEAAHLFEDVGYSWAMQGQAVVLSARGAPPPPLSRDTLLSLVEDDWAETAAQVAGVLGAMRPGVDGDVAGILSLSESFEQSALTALEREAVAAGFDWFVVDESAFRDMLATG